MVLENGVKGIILHNQISGSIGGKAVNGGAVLGGKTVIVAVYLRGEVVVGLGKLKLSIDVHHVVLEHLLLEG